MTNLWLMLAIVGVIACLLTVRKQQKQIHALQRWRELIEQHASSVAPEQEYV